MEILRKMNLKKVILIMCAAISIFSFSFSFESIAAQTDALSFSVPYAKPKCDAYSGFFSVAYKRADGVPHIYTYFWNIIPHGESGYSLDKSVQMDINVRADNIITFTPYYLGGSTADVLICAYDDTDVVVLHSGIVTLNNYVLTESWQNGYAFQGFQFGGNVGTLSLYPTRSSVVEIKWSDSVDASILYSLLSQLKDNDTYYGNLLSSLLNNVLSGQITTQEFINESNAILRRIFGALNASSAQNSALSDFDDNASSQSDEIREQMSHDVLVRDENIDSDPISIIGSDNIVIFADAISVVTNNSVISMMLLVVFSVALISYVLFGKR